MFTFLFRHTSPWAGGQKKVFFYKGHVPDQVHPGSDGAFHSFTHRELRDFVEVASKALVQWPYDDGGPTLIVPVGTQVRY